MHCTSGQHLAALQSILVLDLMRCFLSRAAERRMTMHKVGSLTDAMCSQVRSQLSSSDNSAALNIVAVDSWKSPTEDTYSQSCGGTAIR